MDVLMAILSSSVWIKVHIESVKGAIESTVWEAL